MYILNEGLNNDVKINIMFFIHYYFLHTDRSYTPDYFSRLSTYINDYAIPCIKVHCTLTREVKKEENADV